LDEWNNFTPLGLILQVKAPPLIGIAATKTTDDRKIGHGMPLHRRAAYRTRRGARLISRAIQSVDFVGRPEAKKMAFRIIAAPEFLAFAADRALGVQFIIAAMQLVQLEFEQTVVVRTSDLAILPELLHDPVCLMR